jgi:hypothetical protein
MEVSGQLRAPTALTRWKSHRYPFGRRLGDPQSRSGRCRVEKTPCSYLDSNSSRAASIPSLWWLSHPGSPLGYTGKLVSQTEEENVEVLQQDGVLRHFSSHCPNYSKWSLSRLFDGGGGRMSWPSRSLDLTPLHFFSGGILKGEVYGAIGHVNSHNTKHDCHSYWTHNLQHYKK